MGFSGFTFHSWEPWFCQITLKWEGEKKKTQTEQPSQNTEHQMPLLVHSGTSCWTTVLIPHFFCSHALKPGEFLRSSHCPTLNGEMPLQLFLIGHWWVWKHTKFFLADGITCSIVSLEYVIPCLSVPLSAFIIVLTDHILLYPFPVVLPSKWKMKHIKPK